MGTVRGREGSLAGEREVYRGGSDPCLTNLSLSVSAPWTKVNGPHPHLASPPSVSFSRRQPPPAHTRKHTGFGNASERDCFGWVYIGELEKKKKNLMD